MSWWKKATNILGYTPFTGFGSLNTLIPNSGKGPLSGTTESLAGSAGVTLPSVSAANKKSSAESAAASNAAALAQEQSGMMGQAAELAKMRARRGFLSTILSGGAAGSALSDLTAARKQLLGQ